jgi:GNAT superfamily N-acetyltransferase
VGGDTAPQVNPEPIGFAGLQRSQRFYDTAYLCRSGVMPEHRGHGRQFRLIRVRELQAKRSGWRYCITDTTDNLASANSLIKAG